MTIFISFFLASSLQLFDGLVVLTVLDLRHTTYNGWEKAFNLARRTYLGINRDLHRCSLHIPCHPWYWRPGLVQKWRWNFEGQNKRSEYMCIVLLIVRSWMLCWKYLTIWMKPWPIEYDIWFQWGPILMFVPISINICYSQWEKNV